MLSKIKSLRPIEPIKLRLQRLGVLRLTNTLYVPIKWAYPLVDAI
jgi:hypothetical protein